MPVSAYVKTNLSAATLAALADYHGSGSDAVSVQTNFLQNLALSLNKLIAGQPIYEAGRFAGVSLQPETPGNCSRSNPSGARPGAA